jgi:hypothetical protein
MEKLRVEINVQRTVCGLVSVPLLMLQLSTDSQFSIGSTKLTECYSSTYYSSTILIEALTEASCPGVNALDP